MITGREVKVDVEHLSETAEEMRDEFRSAVRRSVSGYSVLEEDIEDEEFC
jgi:hypothetical protein